MHAVRLLGRTWICLGLTTAPVAVRPKEVLEIHPVALPRPQQQTRRSNRRQIGLCMLSPQHWSMWLANRTELALLLVAALQFQRPTRNPRSLLPTVSILIDTP